jgi:hypothetical protein
VNAASLPLLVAAGLHGWMNAQSVNAPEIHLKAIISIDH